MLYISWDSICLENVSIVFLFIISILNEFVHLGLNVVTYQLVHCVWWRFKWNRIRSCNESVWPSNQDICLFGENDAWICLLNWKLNQMC